MSAATVRPVRAARDRATAPASGLEVHKFGGAALADAAAVRRAVALVAARGGAPTVVVASAAAGVTDGLVALADAAPGLDDERLAVEVARLRAQHLACAEALLDGARLADVRRAVDGAMEELLALARAARVVGHVAPRARDRLIAQGDRLSAQILAQALGAAGVAAACVDAARCIATDGRHGDAAPDVARTAVVARLALRPHLGEGVVPVVPGFVGGGEDGAVVTLGRGGSDLSATVLARALGAEAVVLWKEVPGLMTADPRVVPGARLLPLVDAREAAELAHHGARVLHPRAVAALGGRTRLRVRSFAAPEAAGTVVRARRADAVRPVRAVAATMDQALVGLVGDGLRAHPGVLARALGALHAADVRASLVSQTASEYAAVFVVCAREAVAAARALRAALAAELARGELREVTVRAGVATVGVVGSGIALDARVPSRVLGALADARVRVLAAAFGTSAAGLSVVVDATRAAEAQRAIHDAFELHRAGGGRAVPAAHADVVLLGAGAIGRALLAQLAAARGSELRVCAVIDTSGWRFDPRGLSRRQLAALAAHKAAGGAIAALPEAHAGSADQALEAVGAHALSRPILVDATAADTGASVARALARGWDVVLANKRPIADSQAGWDQLRDAAARGGRHLLHEATVGAGLPVLDTLRKLLEAGDRVLAIEGCPSGTLGFVFGELGRGRRFSAALRAAVDAGYTEPDPRVDLSGTDVARKALILARQLGHRGDLSDVVVESLVPAALRDVPVAEFLARLEECDAEWEARVRATRARGRVLRYRIRVTPRGIAVGLVDVAPTDPLGGLTGTDNQFAFTTARYRTQPLVVTGPGAGAEVTASGVYGDLLRIAEVGGRERRGAAR